MPLRSPQRATPPRLGSAGGYLQSVPLGIPLVGKNYRRYLRSSTLMNLDGGVNDFLMQSKLLAYTVGR